MNNKKDKIYVTVMALCAIVALALLISFWIDKKAQKNIVIEETPIATLKPKEDKVKITVNTQIIQDGLNDMGFLVTSEYYFTQVEEYTKSKKILKILPSESGFTYSYDGSVTAGVDLEHVKVNKDDDKKLITIEIPNSRIQTVIIDKNTFKVYSEKESIWNSLNIEDYNLSLSEFEDAAKATIHS